MDTVASPPRRRRRARTVGTVVNDSEESSRAMASGADPGLGTVNEEPSSGRGEQQDR